MTRNTEYHFRDERCVAVRDRHSRRFLPAHIALDKELQGGVKLHANGAVVPSVDPPMVGDAIFFDYRAPDGQTRQIVTSRVTAIERPPKTDLQHYLG
jgi:hypothetical protein